MNIQTLSASFPFVLIVAKCNVNVIVISPLALVPCVLIVAKCNVNYDFKIVQGLRTAY